jgi:hypothetical protein
MEKERQLDGRMLDDLNKLVEHHEQQRHSQTTPDSDSGPDTPDARQTGAPSVA